MEPVEGRPRRGLLGIAAVLVLAGAIAAYLYFPGARSNLAPQVSPKPPPSVSATAFASADSAWVVLADHQGRSAVFATTDRGSSWKRQLSLPEGSRVRSLQPIGSRQAVLTMASRAAPEEIEFYVTADAGNRWTEVPASGLQASTLSVTFIDIDHAWAAGSTIGNVAVTSLYHSVDGGRSWTKVADFPTATEITGFVGSGLSFRTDADGWLSTVTRGKEPMLYPQPFVLGTRDGGSHWEEQPLPAPENGWPAGQTIRAAAPVCFDGGTCLLTAFASNTTGGNATQPTLIYESIDSGRTWTGPMTTPGPGMAVYFGSTTLWWATTAALTETQWGTSLFVTADGGRTWSAVQPVLPPSIVLLSSVSIQSPQVAWAFGVRFSWIAGRMATEPLLVRTTSGGAKWSEVRLPSL